MTRRYGLSIDAAEPAPGETTALLLLTEGELRHLLTAVTPDTNTREVTVWAAVSLAKAISAQRAALAAPSEEGVPA